MSYATFNQAARWSGITQHAPAAPGVGVIDVRHQFSGPLDHRLTRAPHHLPGFGRTSAAISRDPGPVSHIETMVIALRHLSPARSQILGLLLAAAQPGACGGNKVLKPLWANEMMDRAYQMVKLTRLLDSRTPPDDRDPMQDNLEWRIAKNLAEALLSLRIARDDETLPCSGLLRDIVRDLAELFGQAVGVVGVSTSIDRLELPSFKRRALVLMASHLVVDILLHAARERCSPRLLVTLDQPRRGFGQLAVGYDDHAVPFGPLDGTYGVIDDLASLLESDVIYSADRSGRIVAGIVFPLR